ncbi:rhomboid family intramembrane serine protease [Polaromonas hydrogenivorans]|uniref:Rhomboid family intramembrane serine protease n=1 Tax=Polaromonas hydrogenivorans TaxID=335476 RepID=A0AAU7LTS8_9BURK
MPDCLAVLFVLVTLGLQLWPGASELLRFSRPSYAQGAFWQPLTAQWVHLGAWHASGNALAFALIVVASSYWVRWPLQMLALLGGYAGVAAVVALDPDCSYYAGASGALHGLLAGNAVSLAFAVRPLRRPAGEGGHSLDAPSPRWRLGLGAALLGAMALKLWLQSGGAFEGAPGRWSFPVYQPAHCAGALGGIGLVVMALAWRAVAAPKIHTERRQ